MIAPSASVEAEASNSASSPVATRSGASITGAGGAFTSTICRVSIEPQPSLAEGSSARSVTVGIPGSAKACSTLTPSAVPPSPKSQVNVAPPRSLSPSNVAS